MSLYDYQVSQRLAAGLELETPGSPPFYALIMAAMRRADTFNLGLLKACWPEVYGELHARYNAAGGILPGDPAAVRQQLAAEMAGRGVDPDMIRLVTGVTPGE